MHDTIAVLDFGSQYSHLIVRRFRELGAHAELFSPDISVEKLKEYRAVVLSGGPQNLSESSALRVDSRVFTLGVPILGICYGMQLMAYELGGKIRAGKKAEYGSTLVSIQRSALFKGLTTKQIAWMSHGDQVTRLPRGFKRIAHSANCPNAAMENQKEKKFALQFHPEVLHTKNGMKVLDNFLKICNIKRTWSMKSFVQDSIATIKETIGDGRAVCALSGGVDSSIAATLVHRAIGKRLSCVFVDTGLMREGEVATIRNRLSKKLGLQLIIVDAQKDFLSALKGVTDPERKRKIIGGLFIKIFEREAKKLGAVKFLVQGTLYTDVVSSGVSSGGTHTAVIKSHHNVGGLPEKMGFTLVEPLRDLYKYEVRKVGDVLKLPKELTYRMPFPGPGLAVRIIGEVTSEKLEVLRSVDVIVTEEMNKTKFVRNPHFFYFAALPDTRSVGVQGDQRTFGRTIVLRAVETAEFLTADWVPLPHALLATISTRITNEVPGITRVVYDITSKPPATVEWE